MNFSNYEIQGDALDELQVAQNEDLIEEVNWLLAEAFEHTTH